MHHRTTASATITTHRRRAAAALATAVLLALGATACGDGPPDQERPALSDTEHDEADVAFATDMVQHHAQALSMVDLTVDRDLDPEVEQVAEEIRAAQGPEIEQLADWLTSWGEEVPETMRDHANAGHDHGDQSAGEAMAESMEGMDADMPGMMSADEMAALADAPDDEFQTMWLEMMVEHHEGAVEMARTEQEQGRYRPAVELAGTIVETQQAEIETMRDLLG